MVALCTPAKFGGFQNGLYSFDINCWKFFVVVVFIVQK